MSSCALVGDRAYFWARKTSEEKPKTYTLIKSITGQYCEAQFSMVAY